MTIVDWFNSASNFSWQNYSVPEHDSCSETSVVGLKNCLTRQMRPVHGVIILAGMYSAYSGWIEYEIAEAIRMDKVIIGVRP